MSSNPLNPPPPPASVCPLSCLLFDVRHMKSIYLLSVSPNMCLFFLKKEKKLDGLTGGEGKVWCLSEELERKSSKCGNQPVAPKNRSAGWQTKGLDIKKCRQRLLTRRQKCSSEQVVTVFCSYTFLILMQPRFHRACPHTPLWTSINHVQKVSFKSCQSRVAAAL